jgi:hypothetical protein
MRGETAAGSQPQPSRHPSVDGTTIPAATQIIDNELNTWILSNGQVFENHALTLSSSVTLVLFYGGSVYQENVHNA